MKRYLYLPVVLLGLGLPIASADAQQPALPGADPVTQTLETVIANTTGGGLPGDPSNLEGDIDKIQNVAGDLQGDLADGDANAALATVIANTTGGQPPGDPSNIGGAIENLRNFGNDVSDALGVGRPLPGL
jgi:hypothetical protein